MKKKLKALLAFVGLMPLAVNGALSANFTNEVGVVNPKLHSAHHAPMFYRRSFMDIDSDLKSLNLAASRTHDWALFNPGTRIVDTHFVFPLMKRDPNDPAAYNFKATDEAIRLTRNCGMDILYRFGPSIERTGTPHFNIKPPKYNGSFNRYADVCSHIVKHYNEGWADGYDWDIKYWEIWNEPNYTDFMWYGSSQSEFIDMFTNVLVKVKRDHPDVKVGGPAMTAWNNTTSNFFHSIISRCKKSGVKPDFVSWHYYGSDPAALVAQPAAVRKWLDSVGCTNTEMIIDEWHYDVSGHSGSWNTKSAVFTTAVLSRFQYTKLDQAYYYGIGYEGLWGLTDNCAGWNKTFYALKMFGQVTSGYTRLVKATNSSNVYILAALTEDRTKGCVLLSDYTTGNSTLSVTLDGVTSLSNVACKALDDSNDLGAATASFSGSTLKVTKPIAKAYGSYLVTFNVVLK